MVRLIAVLLVATACGVASFATPMARHGSVVRFGSPPRVVMAQDSGWSCLSWVASELVRLVHTRPSTELGAANWLTLVKPLTRLIFTAVSWPAEFPRTKMASSSWVR